MKTLAFLLEEPSARGMLESLLPRLLPETVAVRYIVFEGKQDLQKQIERRLRGWQAPNTCFIVLHDQDSSDCRAIKQRLVESCRNAGRPDAVVRIACRELEAFYLGDLQAVSQALALPGLPREQASRKFRAPDTLNNAKQELLKLTNDRYQPIQGSRAIGRHLQLDGSNRSTSFGHLLASIRDLLDGGRQWQS